MSPTIYLLAAIFVTYLPTCINGHGRMLDPFSRMSAYLGGFSTPVNYNDHEMNCGGRAVQWQQNGGKCGICGDPWSGPRLYERPNGALVQHDVITRTYLENQVINIRIQITANHLGWMEFRLCDVAKSGGVEATHACLNMNLLADEHGQTRFPLKSKETGLYDYTVVLPEGLTCEHCVLQWWWKCGNDWGCGDYGCCVGCGDVQEEFYACADVTIKPRSGSFPTTASTRPTTTTPPPTTRRPYYTTTPPPTTRRPYYTTTPPPQPTTRQPYYSTTRGSYYTTTRRPYYSTPSPTPYSTTRRYYPTTQPTWAPTTRTTRTTYKPYTTPKPSTTAKLSGYIAWMEYLKNLSPAENTNNNNKLTFNSPQSSLEAQVYSNSTASDELLRTVIGTQSTYRVENGIISVPMVKNGQNSDVYLTKDERDRLCASCAVGCRFGECFKQCSGLCI